MFESVVTKEEVLAVIGSEEIYRMYFAGFALGASICSPLREDNNPSFAFYVNNGEIKWYDFALKEGGDCFEFVSKLLRISYGQAVTLVYADAKRRNARGIPTSSLTQTTRPFFKAPAIIEIIKQPYTRTDYLYWLQYGVTIRTLHIFECYSAKETFVNDRLLWRYSKVQPLYAYHQDGKYKLYRPHGPKGLKHKTNFNKELWGIKMLNNTNTNALHSNTNASLSEFIITKSAKDVMTLYELGFASVCTQSESSGFTDYAFLHKANPVVLYDNDSAGIYGAQVLKEQYGYRNIILPECKDISDYRKKFGRDKSIITLNELLKDKSK